MESFGRLDKTHQGLASQTIHHQNEADRKGGFRLATALAIIPLVLAAGCTCGRDVRQAQQVATVDAAPQEAQKGYVEFYSTAHNAPIPIFLETDPAKPQSLAAIGVNHDDKYSHARHGMIMGEKLRVALPPGDHMFRVGHDGEAVKVPVVDGQVTPVEIDYTLLEEGDTFVVYHFKHHVFSPAPTKETSLSK
jgi:hypothetical protein